jgi:hypothetical protein
LRMISGGLVEVLIYELSIRAIGYDKSAWWSMLEWRDDKHFGTGIVTAHVRAHTCGTMYCSNILTRRPD